tara:strand:+ start:788 stop:1249 length:462 start_codon:yes stop_codon:yes gene_type:complete
MLIKRVLLSFFIAGFLISIPNKGWAQTQVEQIHAVREASNAALKALDEETNFNYLTDDILITTGNGTLLSGKEALKQYIESATSSQPMYWVRTSEEIIVNQDRGLAWEQGVWNAYYADDQDGNISIYHGKYSAMWTLEMTKWKIKSQLFVTLN